MAKKSAPSAPSDEQLSEAPVQSPTPLSDDALESVFPIVGVGASAGGLEAFNELLTTLPEAPGMAFIFILHQEAKHESGLPHVLSRTSKMPVESVEDKVRVQPDRLYVAPPDAELSIEEGFLRLHDRPTGLSLPIDAFFRTLAEDQGSRAIGVILSGMASDGLLGAKAIKAEGGITFAQDDTARFSGMPHNAIQAGFIDFVLSPHGIAEELVRMARHAYVRGAGGETARLPEPDLTKLFNMLRSAHDVDFSHYKPSTVERRIRRRMALHKSESLRDYLVKIREMPAELEDLFADILIRVTGFFRDPEVFAMLQTEVFPKLLENRSDGDALRLWVPGCATGEEVYSLAMVLMEVAGERNANPPVQIFGTDVSEAAVDRARAGIYPQNIAAEVGPERLRRFFDPVDAGYRVAKDVRDRCIFARQNVTKDPPFSRVDLISCRNVMIYLGAALQRKVMSIFHYALRPGGYLLLGGSETIGNFGEMFAVVDRRHKIFKKKVGSYRLPVDFGPTASQKEKPERIRMEDETTLPTNVSREVDRVLLARYTPSGVLIDDNMNVLQFRGRTSRFLEPPSGTASFNLLKMAREGLLVELRAAIHQARKTEAAARREGVEVKTNDHTISVNIEVIPFASSTGERYQVVLFEETPDREGSEKPRRKGKKSTKVSSDSRQMTRLKRELEATREYLQSIIEEQESMNKVLRAANDEIQSNNEEFQSTNEELETAKEELQSSNEELTTLNEELQNRNEELAGLNNDLVNLLGAVEMPIVMVDGAMRIRRFNPSAQRMLNLIPTDLGRPISDIKHTLHLDNLEDVIGEVLETLEVREVEAQDRGGRWQSVRIRPYKTTDNKIDGAVLVVVAVDEFRTYTTRDRA
jgi:two-component system CheB/CheR fusion protein